MLTQWRDHNGNRILYLDCRQLDREQMPEILEEAAEIMRPLTDKILVLANVSDVLLAPEFMEKMKLLTKEVYAHKVAHTAIVGVEGLKRSILKTYNFIMNRDVHTFDTEEEALAWLTKE